LERFTISSIAQLPSALLYIEEAYRKKFGSPKRGSV
jgi:hypothetical protein